MSAGLHVSVRTSEVTLCGLARRSVTIISPGDVHTLHESWDDLKCAECFTHPNLPLLLLEDSVL